MLESPEFIALSFYSPLIEEIEIDFVLRELRRYRDFREKVCMCMHLCVYVCVAK